MSNAAHSSNSPPTGSVAPRARRASITEMFSRPGNGVPPPLNTNGTTTTPLFTAAAVSGNQHQPGRRRMSITTLGLSGSPTNQSAPFGQAIAATPITPAPPAGRRRRGSVSSSILSSSPTTDQAVVEEDDDEEENNDETPQPISGSPFTRRVSFSFRDRAASVNGIYQPPPIPEELSAPSYTYQATFSNHNRGGSFGEGFNWPEALRTRAERAPSLAGSFSMHQQQGQGQGHGPTHPQSLSGASTTNSSPSSSPSLSSSFSSASLSGKHHRSASVATMEAYKPPPKELLERHPSSPPPPSQPKKQQQQSKPRPKPDYFQEKILRADFMD